MSKESITEKEFEKLKKKERSKYFRLDEVIRVLDKKSGEYKLCYVDKSRWRGNKKVFEITPNKHERIAKAYVIGTGCDWEASRFFNRDFFSAYKLGWRTGVGFTKHGKFKIDKKEGWDLLSNISMYSFLSSKKYHHQDVLLELLRQDNIRRLKEIKKDLVEERESLKSKLKKTAKKQAKKEEDIKSALKNAEKELERVAEQESKTNKVKVHTRK